MGTAAENGSTIQTFIELSETLTGHGNLARKRDGDKSLAESYYILIESAFHGQRLSKLLSTFGSLKGEGNSRLKEIDERIMRDEELGEIAREIVMLWYMSGFRPPNETRDTAPQTPEQYFQGLFWPTIRAHPLGLSGGYFGYWKYPPEN